MGFYFFVSSSWQRWMVYLPNNVWLHYSTRCIQICPWGSLCSSCVLNRYSALCSITYFRSNAIGLNTSRDWICPSRNWGISGYIPQMRVAEKMAVFQFFCCKLSKMALLLVYGMITIILWNIPDFSQIGLPRPLPRRRSIRRCSLRVRRLIVNYTTVLLT